MSNEYRYTFTNAGPDVPAHSVRTAFADTLQSAIGIAGELAEMFAADVLISDTDPETAGPVARIVWLG